MLVQKRANVKEYNHLYFSITFGALKKNQNKYVESITKTIFYQTLSKKKKKRCQLSWASYQNKFPSNFDPMSFGRHRFCNTADVNTHSIAPSYFEPIWCFRFIYQGNRFSCGTKVKMNNNLTEKMKGILTRLFICNNDSCFLVISAIKRCRQSGRPNILSGTKI